jgi:hypothetical protein
VTLWIPRNPQAPVPRNRSSQALWIGTYERVDTLFPAAGGSEGTAHPPKKRKSKGIPRSTRGTRGPLGSGTSVPGSDAAGVHERAEVLPERLVEPVTYEADPSVVRRRRASPDVTDRGSFPVRFEAELDGVLRADRPERPPHHIVRGAPLR